jgi:hypothetical protein
MSKPRDPQTPEEWREAVDAAAFMRAIYDCYLYGLLTGPEINAARCDELLERGAKLGYRPRPIRELMAGDTAG